MNVRMKVKPASVREYPHAANRREARAAAATARHRGPLQLGRSARPRRRAHPGRTHGARHRARLCPGQAVSPCPPRQSRGALRSRHREGNGRAGPSRPDDPGRVRRRRARLRRLWIDHAGDRAGGFRLSLRHVGAVLAGHASHLQVRQRGATQEIPAEARNRRDRRLLWPHRARPRLRSGLDGNPGRACPRGLSPQRQQDVDHQFARGRCRPGLGQARRCHSRLPGRAWDHGLLHAEDRRKAFAARLDHRRDRAR